MTKPMRQHEDEPMADRQDPGAGFIDGFSLEDLDGSSEVMTFEEMNRLIENSMSGGPAETLFEADDAIGADQEDGIVKEPFAPSIDEGDFADPAQRALFRILKHHIRDGCNVNSQDRVRRDALEWVFVPTTPDNDQIDFDTACLALCARPVVVRARVAHKLWEAGIILGRPLPFLAALPPSSVVSEIELMLGGKNRAGTVHGEIARAIWAWPSIHSEELRAQFSELGHDIYVGALNDLLGEGYVGVNAARFYFISRNPAMLTPAQRAHWQFATSILGDY